MPLFRNFIIIFAKNRWKTRFGLWHNVFIYNRLENGKKYVFRKCPKLQKAANHLRKIKPVIIRILTCNLTNFIRDWKCKSGTFAKKNQTNGLTLWLSEGFKAVKEKCQKRKLLSVRVSESIPLEQGLRLFTIIKITDFMCQRVFH